MDGGQMMAAILGPRRQHFVYLISIFIAVFIGLIAYISFREILLPVFMALFAWQNWQMYQNSTRR